MTDLRQAAQQALEALETYKGFIDDAHIIEGQWHWLDGSDNAITALRTALEQPQQEQMRMPKAGDKVICLEDESIGTIVSLTAGGSPDITFDDGSRGTYMVNEFAKLFGYVTPPAAQPEQGPVISAWSLREVYFDEDGEPSMHRSPPAAPEQEPFAFCYVKKGRSVDILTFDDAPSDAVEGTLFPLYTTPPAAQRPWIGLTDDEILEAAQIDAPDTWLFETAYAIEVLLKERNT